MLSRLVNSGGRRNFFASGASNVEDDPDYGDEDDYAEPSYAMKLRLLVLKSGLEKGIVRSRFIFLISAWHNYTPSCLRPTIDHGIVYGA
jgi:hypothetical protein